MKRCLLVLVAALGVLALSQEVGIAAPRHAEHPAEVVRNKGNAERARNVAARKSAGGARSTTITITITVSSEDTLWAIAADSLGGDRNGRRISRHWVRIYRANRDVIGNDPNLILPGQVLTLPSVGAALAPTVRDTETADGRPKRRVSDSDTGEGKSGTRAGTRASTKAGTKAGARASTKAGTKARNKDIETGHSTKSVGDSSNFYIDALAVLAGLAALALALLFVARRFPRSFSLGASWFKSSVGQLLTPRRVPSHSSSGAFHFHWRTTAQKARTSKDRSYGRLQLKNGRVIEGWVANPWRPWEGSETSIEMPAALDENATPKGMFAGRLLPAHRELVAWADVQALDIWSTSNCMISIHWEDDCCVLDCTGTLDAEGGIALREAVESCLAANHSCIRIDSSGLKRIDAADAAILTEVRELSSKASVAARSREESGTTRPHPLLMLEKLADELVKAERESVGSARRQASTALNGRSYSPEEGTSSTDPGEPTRVAPTAAGDAGPVPKRDPAPGTPAAADSLFETASDVVDLLTEAVRNVAWLIREHERRGESIDRALVEAIAAGEATLQALLRPRQEADFLPVDDAHEESEEASPVASGDALKSDRRPNRGTFRIDAVLADLPGSEPARRAEGAHRRRGRRAR